MTTATTTQTQYIGKGYFHTCDVYKWEGDYDDMENEVNYANLQEDYGDAVYNILNTQEGSEYVLPHDDFLHENRTMEEWLLEEYTELSHKHPVLVLVWCRRYATITSEDNWKTYQSDEYGSGDWGADEFLIYKGVIIPQNHRNELESFVFPHPYVGG